MHTLFLVLLNVIIAGFVGGLTNHYAIKMLFHPREEKRIGRWRVPFTPGLIPKRKEEIGRSLGKVVSDHLVTTEGLLGLLRKPAFRGRIEEKLRAVVTDWTSREETIRELLLRVWPEDRLDQNRKRLAEWAEGKLTDGLRRLWVDGGWSSRKLGSLLPDWSGERREELVSRALRLLTDEIRKEMDSLQGERMLRQMTSQFMEQTGGFLGALAGMFMDEGKMAGKVKQALLQQLESPHLQGFVSGFIRDRLIRLEELTLEEALRLVVSGRDPEDWLVEQAGRWVDLRGWLDHAEVRRISDIFHPYREWIQAQIPAVTDRLLQLLGTNMSRLVAAVELPLLVEEEVRKFPIEQLEDIILSVSGKEFRAITWLGVVLGGLIGLFQSFLILLY